VNAWKPQLSELIDARYRALVGYAVLVTGGDSHAEDLVQDAILGAYGSLRRFEDIEAAEAYVRRSIVNRHIDTRRRANRIPSLLRRSAAIRAAAPDPAVAAVAATDVQRALASLAPRERACVVLRHMDQLSTRETAVALGLAEGTVKRYLADAVAKLAFALDIDDQSSTEVIAVRKHP
jgi:RNA polymerase sigma factor (sigma-70 family)